MSARSRSKAVSIFVIIVIAMLLFSVMGVMVLYLNGPVIPAQTAGLSGINTLPPAQDTGRVLYQDPTIKATGTGTDTLPDQPTTSTGN